MHRADVASLRAAFWTFRALVSARRQLRRSGIGGLLLPAVPNVPSRAARGVFAILRRQRPTCLERALVLQRWCAAHGELRDVIVGVQGSGEHFRAHAWLEDDSLPTTGFAELLRVAP